MSCDNSANGVEGSRQLPAPLKTLVAGLGNPILGDDGVGWRVAEASRNQSLPPTAEYMLWK